MELTNYLNLGLKDDFLKLMDCMLFDLERKCDLKNGQIILKSKEEIEKYFFQYYYESCFKIAVLLSAKENIDIRLLKFGIERGTNLYLSKLKKQSIK